jgi:KUP system potassium uptake protein
MNSSSATKRITVASLLVAFGIIYGDIGTSPLYVLKAIIGDRRIDEVLVYGGVSCIFWTLVFQTTIKYVVLTLMADNDGEGGVFSLYALVKRYGHKLVIPTILGATTLLADGIITPPISVSSAIEGLEKIVPDLPTIPIVVIILSLLFFSQRFGTDRVGKAFGPIMVLWFTMLFILGVAEIIRYPDAIKMLSPVYAYQLLAQYPHGFWLLGSVFLATTGAEALYSDLGHCGKNNIRVTWGFVKICLMANYLGQAAWLLNQDQPFLNSRNPFFEIIPAPFLLPGILIATLAAIIASQALISGSYTLISEAMSLNFWPRVTVRQPTNLKGQIYIPSVNVILWVGCLAVVFYFKSSTHMEAAYGFFITIAMLVTTYLLSFFLRFRKKWKRPWVVLTIFIFTVIELSFFITNIAKLKEQWMFLIFPVTVFAVMYVWFYSRKINNRLMRFVELPDYIPLIKELSNDHEVPKFATHLVYLTKANHRDHVEEKIMKSIFSKSPKRADVYWFLHINRTDQPFTLAYDVTELLDDKMIKVTIHIGFRVQPRSELYFKKIVSELVANRELNLHIRPDGSTKYNPEPDFKFVIIEKFLSVENEFAIGEGLLLNGYFMLKQLSQRDEKAFGLDKSDVVVEQVPLVYHRVEQINLLRVGADH